MVIKFSEYQLRTRIRNRNSLQCPILFYKVLIRYKEKFHAAQSSGSKGLMTRYVHPFSFSSDQYEVNQKSVLDITINLRSKTPPKVLRNQSAEQANGPNLGNTYRTNALNPVTIMSLLLPVRLSF